MHELVYCISGHQNRELRCDAEARHSFHAVSSKPTRAISAARQDDRLSFTRLVGHISLCRKHVRMAKCVKEGLATIKFPDHVAFDEDK